MKHSQVRKVIKVIKVIKLQNEKLIFVHIWRIQQASAIDASNSAHLFKIFINNKKTCENVWNFEKKALTL